MVSNGDEQRGDVFAVLARLAEGGAGAMRLNPLRLELDLDDIRIRVRAFDPTMGGRLLDADIFDHASSRVIETT